MSEMTWGQAKQQVAQVVGGQSDPEVLQAAEAQITAVIQDWNTRRNWQFLQIIAPDIDITPGTSEYDLPAPFKRPYGALLVASGRNLGYLTRRQYNMVRPASQATTSHPEYYTLFNNSATGKIELLPPNGITDTLRVWYYRLMVDGPSSDADQLDILGRYANYVLDGARSRLIGLRGPVEKLSYWQGNAEAGFLRAVGDDEHIPDEDAGFAPLVSHRGAPPINSFEWVDIQDW